jgi:D-alanyl-D-alanine dipeptidase
MAGGSFVQHPLEWWHFDRRPLEQLKGKVSLLNT